MPKYRVEQYEVHVSTYLIEAETPGEAIQNLLQDNADLSNSQYIQADETRGMSSSKLSDADRKLLGLESIDKVHTIRSVKEVNET